MQDDVIPQFFTQDAGGDSQSVYKAAIDNLVALQSSQMRARKEQNSPPEPYAIILDGIPGIPFEQGSNPNPDMFYQGEDIVYDVFLFHDGAPVDSTHYEVKVFVKTSPRAATVLWEGRLETGIYKMSGDAGYYEVWIPSAATSTFFAGTYYITVLIQERVGEGKGRFDRKYVMLNQCFNIEYGNFSPNPESVSQIGTSPNRSTVEETWPNKPNTVGKTPATNDAVFFSS